MSKSNGHCAICQQATKQAELLPMGAVRTQFSGYLSVKYHERWTEGAHICFKCLKSERFNYILKQMEQERGDLSTVEKDVAERAASHTAIAENLEHSFMRTATLGEWVADRVAQIAGSWKFIIIFIVLLLAWLVVNSYWLRDRSFDPYPFILLNLILSCIAALQAPLIMMSQNRYAQRDRVRAEHDFRINLKAELEIGSLHEKLDHLLHSQWQRMVEFQEMQIDLLTERSEKK